MQDKLMKVSPHKLPTLAEIVEESELKTKQDALTVILNQEPPKSWVKPHPLAKKKNEEGVFVPTEYIPIERQEYLATAIFGGWWSEVIFPPSLIGNSVAVTVRVFVRNPITGEVMHQDGVGAVAIQIDKGESAIDFTKMKTGAIQIGLPSAESYAIKDAFEKFGKIFGKDLNRRDEIDYMNLYKQPITHEQIKEEFEQLGARLSQEDLKEGKRIIDTKDTTSYNKLHRKLTE